MLTKIRWIRQSLFLVILLLIISNSNASAAVRDVSSDFPTSQQEETTKIDFKAEPSVIEEGDHTILSWDPPVGYECKADFGTDKTKPVKTYGMTSVRINVYPAKTTEYTLTCSNGDEEITAKTTIKVVPKVECDRWHIDWETSPEWPIAPAKVDIDTNVSGGQPPDTFVWEVGSDSNEVPTYVEDDQNSSEIDGVVPEFIFEGAMVNDTKYYSLSTNDPAPSFIFRKSGKHYLNLYVSLNGSEEPMKYCGEREFNIYKNKFSHFADYSFDVMDAVIGAISEYMTYTGAQLLNKFGFDNTLFLSTEAFFNDNSFLFLLLPIILIALIVLLRQRINKLPLSKRINTLLLNITFGFVIVGCLMFSGVILGFYQIWHFDFFECQIIIFFIAFLLSFLLLFFPPNPLHHKITFALKFFLLFMIGMTWLATVLFQMLAWAGV